MLYRHLLLLPVGLIVTLTGCSDPAPPVAPPAVTVTVPAPVLPATTPVAPAPTPDPCTPESYNPTDCSTYHTWMEYDPRLGQRECDSILGCNSWYWPEGQTVDPQRAAELGDVEQPADAGTAPYYSGEGTYYELPGAGPAFPHQDEPGFCSDGTYDSANCY